MFLKQHHSVTFHEATSCLRDMTYSHFPFLFPQEEAIHKDYRQLYRKVAHEAEHTYCRAMFDNKTQSIKNYGKISILCVYSNSTKLMDNTLFFQSVRRVILVHLLIVDQ